MDNTITVLVNKDKTLQKTKGRIIYEKENRADTIQFLIDKDFFEYIEDCNIMLQVLLPYPDEEHGTDVTGKMRYMEIEPELYKDRYRMTLPITTVLTQKPGEIIMWFMFFNTTDPNNIILIKTDSAKIEIIPTKNSSSTEISDDESYDVLTKMQQDIDQLQINKMDKYFEYNEEDSTIQFFSNGAPIGSPIKIDDEISWQNWS